MKKTFFAVIAAFVASVVFATVTVDDEKTGIPTAGGGSGTVSSVAATGANGITVTGSPITGTGTLALSLGNITPTTIATGTATTGQLLSTHAIANTPVVGINASGNAVGRKAWAYEGDGGQVLKFRRWSDAFGAAAAAVWRHICVLGDSQSEWHHCPALLEWRYVACAHCRRSLEFGEGSRHLRGIGPDPGAADCRAVACLRRGNSGRQGHRDRCHAGDIPRSAGGRWGEHRSRLLQRNSLARRIT
jgi:hypothetical protein